MATLKFATDSPYKTQAKAPPTEDTQYYKHLAELKLEGTSNKSTYGVAIFGVGRAGTLHLSYLRKSTRAKILYIIDDDGDKLKKVQAFWNIEGAKFIRSSESDQVFNDLNVRFVVISSPTFTHEQLIKEALNHNKAVFCEKPIGESYEIAKSCYELAERMKQPLFSAFNRRFDPAYSSIIKRVRQGDIGRVLTVKVCSRDSPLPSIDYLKISGGIFHDCAVHDIDQIVAILGEYPTKVSVLAHANIAEIKAIKDYDTVAAILSFKSGTLGLIDLSRHCSFGYDQRLEVFGEKGMLKAENRHPLQNVECYSHAGLEKAPIDYSFPSRYKEAYENEIEHFLDVLDGKCPLMIDGKDNLAVTKIASALEKSARSGKIIDITWAADELK